MHLVTLPLAVVAILTLASGAILPDLWPGRHHYPHGYGYGNKAGVQPRSSSTATPLEGQVFPQPSQSTSITPLEGQSFPQPTRSSTTTPLEGQSFPQPTPTSSTTPLEGQSFPQPTPTSTTTPLEGQSFPQPTPTSSTTPFEGQSFPQPTPTSPITSANGPASTGSLGSSSGGKKGAGVWASPKLDSAVEEIGASWAYSWGPDPENAFTYQSNGAPSGVELVPLIGTGQNTTDTFASIKSKGYKTILGYNEPDGSVGSISASDAANSWPDFVATGLRVGSPAPMGTSPKQGDWFYDFMTQIKAKGSKVDFIALHHYASELNDVNASVTNFQKYIQSVYDTYKLPIWVTEFAMIDYSTNPPTVPDQGTEAQYLTAACQMLEGLDFVERYAWFAVPQNAKQPATSLADPSGNLNALGNAYKALWSRTRYMMICWFRK